PTNPHGGQLGEAYIHGTNGIAEGVRQVRTTAVNQISGLEHIVVTAGTGVPTSGLLLGVDRCRHRSRARPRFVDIVGPYRKWGGDNSDAFYQFAPIDPSRTYRVRGLIGDAVYLSLTVYGGPDDGRYSERIVGSVNNR